jgi:hypothetical protein
MIRLLYPEVDIEPGRRATPPALLPVPEGQSMHGSAFVRVTNSTSQENAYTIRLDCDHPRWDENWSTIVSLPPAAGHPENAPPAGKPDQRGPHDRWVKIYVPSRGTRDMWIRFDVPRRPEARAGRYACRIEVETEVVAPGDGSRRRGRVTELPAVAIVRPFYRWSLDMTPEQRRVGRFFRRRGEFEVVVTNEGNDWLYCDLKLPRPPDLLLEVPTLRMAVPPAEPGERLPGEPGQDDRTGTRRTVPLRAVTRLKTLRGHVVPQPVLLSAVRVDAPSVPPLPTDTADAGVGVVVANVTSEAQQLSGDRSLLYCPLIPATLSDFVGRIGGSIQGLRITVIALVVALHLAVLICERIVHDGIEAKPLSSTARPGEPLTPAGAGSLSITSVRNDFSSLRIG